MTQGRGLLRQIFSNFLNSLKPKKYWGEFRGSDYMGTEYYEIPVSSQHRKRPCRWFVPKNPHNFEQDIPPEWEAWLRHRRKEPPTKEEILLNLQEMMRRIENAKQFEKPQTLKSNEIKSDKVPFPKYEDYKSLD